MPERKTSRPRLSAAIAVCVLLAMIGGYAGAYYGTVRPNGEVPEYPRLHGEPGERFTDWVRSWNFWHSFFTPMHWLDRRIRPHVWEPTP